MPAEATVSEKSSSSRSNSASTARLSSARFDGYRRVAVDQQFDLVAGRAGAAHDEHIRALKFAFSRFDYLFRVDHVSEIRSYMV